MSLYGIKLSNDSDSATVIDTLTTYDLAMALDGFEISEPVIRTDYKTVRGLDGVLDASEAPQGYPTFEPRTIKLRLFKSPTPYTPMKDISSLMTKRDTIMASWQGRRVRMWLPNDSTHYWIGRITVGPLEAGEGLIPIECTVYPYKLKNSQTTITITDLTTSFKTYSLSNERRFVVPEITIAQNTTIQILQGPLGTPPEVYLALPSGQSSATFRLPDTLLMDGTVQMKAKLSASGTNSLIIKYREGTF